MAEQHPELVKKYYGKLADTSKDAVTAFNTAFAQDGVLMYVPKNVIVDRPIQLVNILRADVNFMVNRRVLIILEEGAQARLLICDHAMDNVNFLATQVIEVFAEENSVFDLYELEETHTSTVRFINLYVKQGANSNVLLNGMTLHNGTTRNTTEVTLAGEGAEINLCGMAIADKNQHVDNNTSIDHAVPNCTSNELFKYVLDDQSVGAFAGLVLVRPDAQHTSSQQTNRNQKMQTIFQRLQTNGINHLVDKCKHQQQTGLLFGDTTSTHIEKSVFIQLTYSSSMRAFYIVGIYLQLRLSIHTGITSSTEVTVCLLRTGILRIRTYQYSAFQ